MNMLSELDIKILNRVQSDFPVCSDPFSVLAIELDIDKALLIKRLSELQQDNTISRFGCVINHRKVGKSLLAALKVPHEKMEDTVTLVNAYLEVNHNYQREHAFNLWFVVTAATQCRLDKVLDELESKTGFPLLRLPMLKPHHINLAFDL